MRLHVTQKMASLYLGSELPTLTPPPATPRWGEQWWGRSREQQGHGFPLYTTWADPISFLCPSHRHHCSCHLGLWWISSLWRNNTMSVKGITARPTGFGIARAKAGYVMYIWIRGYRIQVSISPRFPLAQEMPINFPWHCVILTD